MDKSLKIFQGRRSTLKKKAGELAALCNSEVCVICFGPTGDLQVWPENPTEAQSIIDKYTEASGKGSKCKRSEKLDLSDLLETKIKKLKKQVFEEEETWDDFNYGSFGGLPLWDEELGMLSDNSLMGLEGYLEAKIRGLTERIESVKGKETMPSADFLLV